MKKRSLLIAALAGMVAISSCRKLDVPVDSQYVSSNFPTTANDYAALLGTMYTNLSANYSIAYWRMQELSTDEAIIPARDGNFNDGNQYMQMHYHTWSYDHPYVTTCWQWGFGGINNCNRLINLINGAAAVDTTTKASTIAEIRAMRALYYFFMMDTYGNVPLITDFPVATLPATQQRADVFKYIESELKAILPALPNKTNVAATNVLQYGRPTRGMAFALLAKMYLNSQVYTGTARWQDVVTMCDSVQANTNYYLDAKYRDVFAPNNGPQINETIFAVPYDQQIAGNQFTRFGFYPALAPTYGFQVSLSIAMSTTPNFYRLFKLPGDFRNQTWLNGPQYYPDGNGGFTNQPAYYPNTTTQIVLTDSLILVPPKPFDIGNTVAAQAEGVRSIKYYPDVTTTQATRLNGNDVPVFRLADVMLEKAEAELRGATVTSVNGEVQTPDVLCNKIRSRVGAPAISGVTLANIIDERARELYWEGWRRNDLIRFGQYEVEYPLANDPMSMTKDVTRRIFPVPITEIRLNPNLVQNPGYTN